MWQGFTIALREGIEMFLILALILSYLKRTGRYALARAVYAGCAISVVTCLGAFFLFQRAANRSLWEGILAIVAAVLVASLLLYMKRVASHLKADIE
ncbi:MAG TPA: FTR1 family protein, partial [Thermoanaerobaculia bacterium]